jgi:ribonuclease E
MRHDDLNKTEPLPASYNLVEAPAEEQKPAAGTSEPAAPRPEAAVKAITPQQPAPVPVAREMRQEPRPQPKAAQVKEASIIGKIFGWFKRKPAQEAPVADVARPVAAHGPRRGRHERADREGPRREREERTTQQGGQRQRQEQAQPQQGQRDGGRHRAEQQRQEPRRPDQPQQQRQHPQRDQAQAESRPPSAPQQPGREQGEQQREGRGRRRRRGGRDRHEQRQVEGGGQPDRSPQAQRVPDRPAAERPSPTVEPVPAAYSPAAAAFPESIAPAEVASHKAPPAVFETETVREFQPREAAPMAAPSGPGYAPAEPVKIEWPSDLKQVESDPEKIQTAQRQVVEEQPVPRPKRVRQAVEPVGNEPLVQIETQASGPATSGTEQKETALPG